MQRFFQAQLDYLFFFYGLGFILLAAICWSRRKRQQDDLPWLWLGLFGLVHGVNEWLDLLAMSLGDGQAFSAVRSVFMTASFVALTEFARLAMAAVWGKSLGRWIYAPLFLLIGGGGLLGGWSGLNAASRYALGLPGGLGAALALNRAAWLRTGSGRRFLSACGAGLGLYGLAAGLIVSQAAYWPASFLNHGSFFDVTGFPIQLVRGILALCVAGSLWYYGEAGRHASTGPTADLLPLRGRSWLAPALMAILAGGWVCTHYVGQHWDAMHRDNVLTRTRTIAATLDSDKIVRLTASRQDVDSQDYNDIRRVFSAVLQADPALRFAYLTRLVGGQAIFLVDSEPADSRDYSPPGQAYPEASSGFLSVLQQGKPVTEGPLPDRYGVWVTALVPVKDGRTERVVGALGLDVDAREWTRGIQLARLLPISLTGLFCVLLIGYFVASQRLRVSAYWILESNQRLEATNHDLEAATGRANEMALAAEQASQAKSDFLANMSHEIRTPLNGVIGMAELLSNTALTTQQFRYAKTIRKSADTLLNLVNDILDFSKIEAGKITLEPVGFDLRAAVEEVAQAVAPNTRNPSVEMIVRYDGQMPRWVVGDPSRIRQIVTNLAGNSVKFTRQGHILLEVQSVPAGQGKATFHLFVQDTGIGIAQDKIETIFEKFSQADASTTRKFGGTGLGLAISRKLLELMGGRIWAESQEGKGSTFHVELTMDLAEPAAGTGERDPVDLADMNVLIVDDNPVNREVLEEMVRTWRMKATPAAGGAEALELLDAARQAGGHFDLVLVDVNMPHMDGFALVDRVRKNHYPVCGPILMLSSSGQSRESILCREMNLAFYLVKPIRRAELLEAIQTAFGRSPDVLPDQEAAGSGHAQFRSLRILLAEDNLVNQDVAVGLLEDLGHTVTVVGNGREAVSAAQAEKFGLIFMDVQMPEMSGYEATTEIRKWERQTGKHLLIVAMTANALKGDAEKCIQAGMDEYVSKPISGERLAEVIAKVMASAPPPDDESPVVVSPPQPASDRETGSPPRAARGAADESGLVDYERFLHRCSGKPAIVSRALNRFLETAGQTFEQIQQALARDDTQQARQHAHSLKGAAANISAEPLRAAAGEMERLAEAGAEGAARSWLLRLQVELERCLTHVQALQTRSKQGS